MREHGGVLEVRVLGTVSLHVDGESVAIGAKTRALVALLVAAAPGTVSAAELCEALWPDRPEEESVGLLRTAVSRLRKSLGPAGGALETVDGGYRLVLADADVDLRRVEETAAEIRSAASTGDDGAVRRLGSRVGDLADVSGRPFDGVDHPSLLPLIKRIEEERVEMRELVLGAAVRSGEASAAIGELAALVDEHPLREPLVRTYAEALYRSGRQADALAAISDLRERLVDSLGVSPEPATDALELAILDHTLEPVGVSRGAGERPDGFEVTDERQDAPDSERVAASTVAPSASSSPGPDLVDGPALFAVLFTDLVGSTQLLDRNGPVAAEQVRRKHNAIVRSVATDHAGTVVKSTGDGALVVFAGAAAALRAAVAVQQRTTVERRRMPDLPVIRVGIDTGEVEVEDHDVFGTPVVVAARLCDGAEDGGILATATTVSLAGKQAPDGIAGGVERRLKGFDQPIEVVAVGWQEESVAARLPPAVEAVRRQPMHGRHRELDQLSALWDRVAGGGRGTVLLRGEPGIGKTRLAAELCAHAGDAGATVLWGRCDEELQLPYEPFRQALDALPASAEHSGLRPLLDPGHGPTTQASESQAQIVASMLDVIRRATVDAPVVLVVDDLQWATSSTQTVVRAIAREASLTSFLLVATTRDTEHTPEIRKLIADLRREVDVTSMDLAGLAVAEIGSWLAAESSDLDAPSLLQQSAGNPFFLAELLRAGAVVAGGELPQSVLDVVVARVEALGPAVVDVLRVAAVEGTEFGAATLLACLPDVDVLDALDRAVAAHLLDESTEPGRFRFVHALGRDAVLAGISRTRRMHLHRQVAESLEAQGAEAPAIAVHYCAAAPLGGIDEAVRWRDAAYLHAAVRGAADDGVEITDRLLEVLPADHRYDDVRRRMQIELITPLMAKGDWTRADEIAERMHEEASRRDDPRLLAQVLLSRMGWGVAGGADEWVDRWLEEGLARIDDLEPLEARDLLHAAAQYVGVNQGLGPKALGLMERARGLGVDPFEPGGLASRDTGLGINPAWIEMVLRAGGPDLDAFAESIDRCEHSAEHFADRFTAAMATGIRDAGIEATVLRERVQLHLRSGDHARALAGIDRMQDIIDELSAETAGIVVLWQGMVHLARGELEDARRSCDELGEMIMGNDNIANSWSAQLLMIHRDAGESEAFLPILEEVARDVPGIVAFQAALGATRIDVGDVDGARAAVTPFAGHVADAVPWDITRAVALADLATVAFGTSDRPLAEEVLDQIEPYAGQLVLVAWGVALRGAADRYLAMLDHTLGRFDRADERFAAALALEESMPFGALTAATRAAWAWSLAERPEPDLDRAQALARACVEFCEPRGLHGIAAPALELLSAREG